MPSVHRRGQSQASVQSPDSPAVPSHSRGASGTGERRLAIQYEAVRELTSWDVAALIINKMVGTGIFTGPPTVLMYTGSKGVALGIWGLGFCYTLISMTLYLEFSRKLPYSGGELNYLDAIIPGKLISLGYTCYALFFVILYTSSTNAMEFARQAILAATGSEDQDLRVLRLIAVAAYTFVCLLLYFSVATARLFNKLVAYSKLFMLFTMLIAGIVKAVAVKELDFTRTIRGGSSHSGFAVLYVLYSFQGWENATFVAGEIPNYKTLHRGFIIAVCTVGLLYFFINLVYFLAIPWDSNDTPDLQYVSMFFGNTDLARMTWAILTSFSAIGNMIGVLYTCVRVNQAIAWANILPWSTFWRRSVSTRPRASSKGNTGSSHVVNTNMDPQGGIVLSWLMGVFFICITAAISDPPETTNNTTTPTTISVVTEAIAFPGHVRIYAEAIVGVFIGLFFYWIRDYQSFLPNERHWSPGKSSWILRNKYATGLFGCIYTIGSFAILVLSAIGPDTNANGTIRKVKGRTYAVICVAFLAGSVCYYFAILFEYTTIPSVAGVEVKMRQHGMKEIEDGVEEIEGGAKENEDELRTCDICKSYEGKAHRHASHGYLYYYEFPVKDKTGRNFFYWAFGGAESKHHPSFHFRDNLAELIEKTKELWVRRQGRGGAQGSEDRSQELERIIVRQ